MVDSGYLVARIMNERTSRSGEKNSWWEFKFLHAFRISYWFDDVLWWFHDEKKRK